jgi:hypothetical protein
MQDQSHPERPLLAYPIGR